MKSSSILAPARTLLLYGGGRRRRLRFYLLRVYRQLTQASERARREENPKYTKRNQK